MGLPPTNTPELPAPSASDAWGQKLNAAIDFRASPSYHEAVLPDRLSKTSMDQAFGAVSGGKSAYQLAQDNGYTGTQAQWLDSLKGAAGTQVVVYDKFADAPPLPVGTMVLSISGL